MKIHTLLYYNGPQLILVRDTCGMYFGTAQVEGTWNAQHPFLLVEVSRQHLNEFNDNKIDLLDLYKKSHKYYSMCLDKQVLVPINFSDVKPHMLPDPDFYATTLGNRIPSAAL